MHIKKIEITNFRNISNISINPSSGFNLLIGKNAQGKSNFLEAIYSLNLGRSYRTYKEEDVILFHKNFAKVYALFKRGELEFSIEILWKKEGNGVKKFIKYNGTPLQKLRQLVGLAPMSLFLAEDLNLIKGEPSTRRRFLDLLISRIYPPMVGTLSNYKKTLQERNQWLKLPHNKKDKGLGDVLEEKLITEGSKIILYRLKIFSTLKENFSKLVKKIFPKEITSPTLIYKSSVEGIKEANYERIKVAFKESIDKHTYKEEHRGFTLVGPHRDDFEAVRDGRSMRHFASSGEVRAVSVLLKLAEIETIHHISQKKPIVLIDDSLNEFDLDKIALFLNFIKEGKQIFYTSTRFHKYFENIKKINAFLVKRGEITPCTLQSLKEY